MADIPDSAPIFEEPPEHTYGRFCVHSKYRVESDARRIVCLSCGGNVDPFKIIEHQAIRQRIREDVEAEIKKKRVVLAALVAEEKRVKARTRNAKKKDADAAVAAERTKAKENHGRAIFNLLCAKKEIETALRQLGNQEQGVDRD